MEFSVEFSVETRGTTVELDLRKPVYSLRFQFLVEG